MNKSIWQTSPTSDIEPTNIRKNSRKKRKGNKTADIDAQRRQHTNPIADSAKNAPKNRASQSESTKRVVVVAGDSLVKNIIGAKMSERDQSHHYVVKPFPGATISDMEDFVKPLVRRSPAKLILHVGTNDMRNASPKVIADSTMNLLTQISGVHQVHT